MDGHLHDDVVYVGGNGRQRFFDASAYGRPLDDPERDRWGANGVALSRVEAAHLLYRGELDAIRDGDRRLGFRAFLARAGPGEDVLVRFLVYADLRERGFYLSPVRPGWPGPDSSSSSGSGVGSDLGSDSKIDFVVYPRGSGPGDGEVAHRVRVVGERESVPIACLSGPVVAVVDEESDVTYFRTRRPALDGATDVSLPRGVQGELLSGRAIAFDPPDRLYRAAFFGQPLGGRSGTEVELLQLSLVEAAYLAAAGVVDFEGDAGSDPDLDSDSAPSPPVPDLSVGGGARGEYRSVVARGRAVEGDRFDRRLRTYAALRDQGLVSKTGFKFGADFRTYAEVESVEQLGHSEHLVRAFPADHRIAPRDLALDVRLAHGVRKEMVFALVGEDVEWRTAGRLTP